MFDLSNRVQSGGVVNPFGFIFLVVEPLSLLLFRKLPQTNMFYFCVSGPHGTVTSAEPKQLKVLPRLQMN